MARILEKILPFAAGAGLIGFLDFLLVEGAGATGVAYDLAYDGYLADFFQTKDPRELFELNELNFGEAISVFAIVASLTLLFFTTRARKAFQRCQNTDSVHHFKIP